MSAGREPTLKTPKDQVAMPSDEFYVMLANPEWAGPGQEVVAGPEVLLYNGTSIEEPIEPYTVVLKVDKQAEDPLDFPPQDIVGPNRSLLFSKRFVELLDGLGVDNVQYIDAEVTYEPTGEQVEYKAANVVGVASGLDMEHSAVLLSPRGNVLNIEVMCFDEDALRGQTMFRLEESRMLIVVHRRVKEAVEDAGLSGFLFVSDAEYEPWMI